MLIHADVPRKVMPSRLCTGDDEFWARWVPAMWQALADPAGTHLWSAYPEGAAQPGDGLAAWWSPAVHLMGYSLAWPHPGTALRRWYDSGRPTGDARLALLAEMLGDHLDELAVWAWMSDALQSFANSVGSSTGARELSLPDRSTPEEPWFAAVASAGMSERNPHGWGNGSDELHLSAHAGLPIWDLNDDTTVKVVTDIATRHAVITVDRYPGWYRTLADRGRQLPPLPGGRSWRVDVLCVPVGHLGTYRRSRVTGRWFAGPHRVHQMGNDSATDWAGS